MHLGLRGRGFVLFIFVEFHDRIIYRLKSLVDSLSEILPPSLQHPLHVKPQVDTDTHKPRPPGCRRGLRAPPSAPSLQTATNHAGSHGPVGCGSLEDSREPAPKRSDNCRATQEPGRLGLWVARSQEGWRRRGLRTLPVHEMQGGH